jgi:2-dehydro-3-deoxy-D-arabinonate dehydratase
MSFCRFSYVSSEGVVDEPWGWLEEGMVYPLPGDTVLAVLSGKKGQTLSELSLAKRSKGFPADSVVFCAPVVEGMEVWAAGVTYESSKLARMSESAGGGNFYAKVYTAQRPELFFKATPNRTVGANGEVRIRADSHWNVPEPELAALISANGTILGYTIGNDMSSRDIEGENPLYLPQAKVYIGSCALGPVVVPAENLTENNLTIELRIWRSGESVFTGQTSTARMRRSVEDLAGWLFRENAFSYGVILLTGTGIIPPDEFTLQGGDEIEIEISGIGVLRNRVAKSQGVEAE